MSKTSRSKAKSKAGSGGRGGGKRHPCGGRCRRDRGGGRRAKVTRPDEAASRIVDHLGLRVEQFVLQGSELCVIQRELELQGAIGHAAPLAQQGDHLIHDRDKVHPMSSLRLRRQRAPSLTGARSPRLRRRREHSLTCPRSPRLRRRRGASLTALLPCLGLDLRAPGRTHHTITLRTLTGYGAALIRSKWVVLPAP